MYRWLVIYPKCEFIVVAPSMRDAMEQAKQGAKARGVRRVKSFEIYKLEAVSNGEVFTENL